MTALIVDLLEPVAREVGLADVVERARGHLSEQIEETGLVRYYGRPDRVYVPGQRCREITPDVDDTALLWRIAPVDARTRLESALRTIDAYRTKEGLYRTWLAPLEKHRCIGHGKDPNPIDVGAQMHLLLFFAKYKSEAAVKLCGPLRRAIVQNRFWVWYPALVPILREAELARQGCEVRVPERRLQHVFPGQQIWIDLARLLGDVVRPGSPRPSTYSVIQALNRLAEETFSALEHTPPLVYHGDLTRHRRFYWSADVGYALWLRLYFEALDRSNDTSSVAASIEELD
jgi:hypothetical protein